MRARDDDEICFTSTNIFFKPIKETVGTQMLKVGSSLNPHSLSLKKTLVLLTYLLLLISPSWPCWTSLDVFAFLSSLFLVSTAAWYSRHGTKFNHAVPGAGNMHF